MYLLYFSIFCIKKPWKLCEPVVSLSYYYVLRQCLMLWCFKFTVWSLCVLLKVFSSHLLSIAFDINSSPSIAYSSSTDMHFIQMYTNCPCFWVLGGCEIVRFVLKSTLLLAFDMMLCGTRPPKKIIWTLNSLFSILLASLDPSISISKPNPLPQEDQQLLTKTYATIKIPYKQRGLYFLFNIFNILKLYGQILRQISFALVNYYRFF